MAKNLKPFFICSGLLIALWGATMWSTSKTTETRKVPVVEILYPPGGSLLDRLCKNDFNVQVDDQALKAAVQMRPEFQKL